MIVDDKRELMTNTQKRKKNCIYNWVANETNKQTGKQKEKGRKGKENNCSSPFYWLIDCDSGSHVDGYVCVFEFHDVID